VKYTGSPIPEFVEANFVTFGAKADNLAATIQVEAFEILLDSDTGYQETYAKMTFSEGCRRR
jgi:hypothetical protein